MKILESGDHLVRKLHESLHRKFPLAAAEEILQIGQRSLVAAFPFLRSRERDFDKSPPKTDQGDP